MEDNKIYAFEYLPCIFEGSWGLISLHKTPTSAKKAMNNHKKMLMDLHNKMYENEEFEQPFGEFERWRVQQYTLLD